MLTPSEAVALMPTPALGVVLEQVEAAIRAKAIEGRYQVDVYSLIPRDPKWDPSISGELAIEVVRELRRLGYKVDQSSGGHNSSASIYVSWKPST